jgi:hypothetical protein
MTNKIFVGDVGTDIILDAGEDITAQTTLLIKYKKPSGLTGSWSATVYQTTKGKYTTVSGDLDESGTWKLQLYVVLPAWSGHGEVAKLPVYDLEID